MHSASLTASANPAAWTKLFPPLPGILGVWRLPCRHTRRSAEEPPFLPHTAGVTPAKTSRQCRTFSGLLVCGYDKLFTAAKNIIFTKYVSSFFIFFLGCGGDGGKVGTADKLRIPSPLHVIDGPKCGQVRNKITETDGGKNGGLPISSITFKSAECHN